MPLPPFPVEGGLALAVARGMADATLLAAFGALLFRALVAPPVLARMERGAAASASLRRFAWFTLLAAALAAAVWVALQAVNLGGTVAAVPLVLRATLFGHLLLLRFALLALAALVLAFRRSAAAAGFTGATVVTQAGLGHAASMYGGPSWLLLSEILHLLAAGAWLGGLLPLLLVVAAANADAAALASHRFSPLGTACVLVLAGTAAFQSFVLIGGLPGWVGTAYGLVALLKIALFSALLGFAARNRFRLTPALSGAAPTTAKRDLMRGIAGETAVGLLVVLAAGLLTSLPPAMHVQPLWPFPWRLSLDAVQEDPDFRREVLLAGIALAGAAALFVTALVVRRRSRWLIAALAVVTAWFAVPHLGLLLADAYPTYYWHSPTGFASGSIVQGATLFPEHCAVCHGTDARGDGPAAKTLPVPPANLTAAHLWMHSDGELFWWISHGIEAPEGGMAMPGFADALSEDERWALIDWVRAHNAGLAFAATGQWPVPVQAPGVEADCPDGRIVTLGDLRGQVVRLIFGTAPPTPGVITILATSDPRARPGAGVCVADDETVPRAYAIVTGIARGELPGTQVLVDGQGWLRAVQRPGASPGWDDRQVLAGAVRDIEAHPLAAGAEHMPMNMRM